MNDTICGAVCWLPHPNASVIGCLLASADRGCMHVYMAIRLPITGFVAAMIASSIWIGLCAPAWATDKPAKAVKKDGKPGKKDGKPGKSGEDEVDWRGLYRMNEKGHTIKKERPPPNPIRDLAQSAPYRIHVATSDGKKVVITDAYTLERWRVFAAEDVRGYAFNNDGAWLYVVHDAGVVSSVNVRNGKAKRMATVKLPDGVEVVEVIGHGKGNHRFVTVVVGKGPRPLVGQPCGTWSGIKRFRIRQKATWPKATVITERGMHDLRLRRRRKGTSPNTRYEVFLGKQLKATNKIGGGSVGVLNRKPLPSRSIGFRWMRDSRGVIVKHRRTTANGCRHRLGVVSFRQPEAQRVAWYRQRRWTRWSLPADVSVVRGDLAHNDVLWAPDGMRVVGVRNGKAVVIEPVARHRGHVAVISPATRYWPAVRPGVRSLVVGTGALRHAEILTEQGDLDTARTQLAAALARTSPKPTEDSVKRLRKRIGKLEVVRRRRALEIGVTDASLRGRRSVAIPTGKGVAVDAGKGAAVDPSSAP